MGRSTRIATQTGWALRWFVCVEVSVGRSTRIATQTGWALRWFVCVEVWVGWSTRIATQTGWALRWFVCVEVSVGWSTRSERGGGGGPMSGLPPTPGERFGVALPGGTSVSHVKVYDTVGPDGLAGGSPHLHTVCTEAYLVIAGEGMVQTLSGEGYAETALVAGTIAWFSPGTIHRLVNLDGRLELYVLMSNAGLPEAGDMILAFAPDLLADDATYRFPRRPPRGRPHHRRRSRSGDATPRRSGRGLRALAVAGRNRGSIIARSVESPRRRAARRPASGLARPPCRRPGHRPRALACFQVEEPWSPDRGRAADRLGESAIRSTSLHPETRAMGCCGTLGTVVH